MPLLIGADPELFIRNVITGKFVSAHNIVPGDKRAPWSCKDGAVQPDGVAAEFNINPAKTHEEFSDHIFSVVNQLRDMVRTGNKNYELVAQPTALFDRPYFKKLPSPVRALGCDPDFDAWHDGKANTITKPKETFRTGAGHLHIGWTDGVDPYEKNHWHKCIEVVKQLDCSLYPCSLMWDADTKRRTLYGRLGSFRPKHYGVEYRPLSNAWVFKPELHPFIFNTIQTVVSALDENGRLWDQPDILTHINMIQNGEPLEDMDILEHYYELYGMNLCEKIPEEYVERLAMDS